MKETNATVINLKRLKDQSLNESPSFCDVNVICDKSNDNFYDEDINNSNEDLLTQEQPEIEIHETKLFCEPIRKPEVKKRFKSKSFRFDLSNQKLLDHYILGSYKIGRHFTCGICGKAFRTRFNLKRHELTHADPELSECSICLKAVQDVERHMKRTHFSKHICDICGSKFATNGNLIKHMRIHSGDRPYICEMCGKNFRQKSILEIHIKSIHTGEKRHVCDTCEKKFTTPAELRKHKMVHIPNKENKFVCEVSGCNKAFLTKGRRHDHMKRHNPEKKHKCTICDKAFVSGQSLRRHHIIHTGEKPFECDTCHKCFNRKSNLQIHIKSHVRKMAS